MDNEAIIKEAVIRQCPKKDKDDRPDSDQRWCLYDHNGDKLLGRHPSKEKATKQERTIQISKHSMDEDIIKYAIKCFNQFYDN